MNKDKMIRRIMRAPRFMAAAARDSRCVRALISSRLARDAAEAGSFWSAFLVDTLVFMIQAAVFWVLYLNVEDIGGWDKWRSIFFVGTFTLVDGLYMTLYFFGVLGIPEAIASGRLDLYLTKPFDPLLHLAFERFNPGSLFLSLPALALIAASASRIGASLSAWSLLGYLAAVALMLILMFDLMVLMRLPAFKLRRLGAFNAAEGALVEFAFRVPGSAYKGGLKLLFRVILPYGLIASFPTETFFGEADWRTWAGAIGVTAAFTALARLGWKRGLSSYESAGG
jgi:ABC-2 type transport system permease protein